MGSWAALDRLTPVPRPPVSHVVTATPETIVKVLSAAHAGDVIQLAPGHYTTQVRVPNGVSLLGPKIGDAVIESAPPAIAPSPIVPQTRP
jgi:hypothetical protein